MTDRTRRTVLQLCGAAAVPLAGCVSDATSTENETSADGSGKQTTGTATVAPDTTATATATAESRSYAFFIANLDDSPYQVEVTIQETASSRTVQDGRYEVPSMTGLIFEDMATVGNTYEVTVSYLGGGKWTREWEAKACDGDGNQSAGVRLEDASMEIGSTDCDQRYTDASTDIVYADASAHSLPNESS